MQFLSHMRIGQDLCAGVAAVTLCLVAMAGSAMQGVVASEQRMSGILGEIARASAVQSSGIERVTHTIHHMDKSAPQNNSLVEQAAAADDSLKAQVPGLEEVVSLFRL